MKSTVYESNFFDEAFSDPHFPASLSAFIAPADYHKHTAQNPPAAASDVWAGAASMEAPVAVERTHEFDAGCPRLSRCETARKEAATLRLMSLQAPARGCGVRQ